MCKVQSRQYVICYNEKRDADDVRDREALSGSLTKRNINRLRDRRTRPTPAAACTHRLARAERRDGTFTHKHLRSR